MSAIANADYAPADAQGRAFAFPIRRLVIAAAGCALMALSGSGLANYLDTSSATGADAAPADTSALN